MDARKTRLEISSVSILGQITKIGTLQKLYGVLKTLDDNCEDFVKSYSELVCYTLSVGGLFNMLEKEILYDSNIFAQKCRSTPFNEINNSLIDAVSHDISVINRIIEEISSMSILEAAANKYKTDREYILSLPKFETGNGFNLENAQQLYDFYKENGYGFFARNYAFTYKDKKIVEIERPDNIKLFDLKGYEDQKKIIINNTKLFLSGELANNILLYGDKGTGKSSTVKAIVNEYKDRGLKIIEVRKEDLSDFQHICEALSRSPFKFIVFLDDISFAREEESFGTLKAVIEGGLVMRPNNVIIYATSNRRHLVKEAFSDRQGDDIHIRDTIETITSLSDRFGIEVVFTVPDKDQYLKIVEELAKEKKLNLDTESLFTLAERFALLKSGRSPRTARQFITSMAAKERH